MLRECRRRFPRVALSLTECNAAEAIERQADGTLSAALLRAPVQHPEGVRFDLLLEEDMVIALPLDHPLLRKRKSAGKGAGKGVQFADVANYPIASTPLSDQVAAALVEAYGPQAHPAACVTLQCEELHSLVEVARRSDAVLLAIRASAPELVELDNPGDQEKDVVVDVSPSGTLEEGDTVTITYYGKPPPGTGPGSGDGEDDEG